MADDSESDLKKAKRIIERMFAVEREAGEVDDQLVVSDVEADAAEFKTELQVLRDCGFDFPAVRIGGDVLVPVALSLLAGPVGWPGSMPLYRQYRMDSFYYDFLYGWLRAVFRDRHRLPDFEWMTHEQARETFSERAAAFLATRIAAVRSVSRSEPQGGFGKFFLNILNRSGGAHVSTPGCHFTVSTNSIGLRVFWSGAYRLSPNYFSHPTTPAQSVLQAGTYLFGVDGGAYGNNIQWDRNAVVTLPGNPQAHLNF